MCSWFSRYRVLRLVGEGTFSQLVVAEDTFAPSPPSQHHLAGMYGSATCNEAPHTSSLQHSAPPGGQQVIPRHRLVALKIMNSKYAFIGVQELDKLYTLNQRDQRSWCPIVRVQGPGAFYFQTHLVIVLELLGPALLAYMKTLPRGRVPVEQLRKIALQLVLALGYVSTAGMIHGDIKPEVRIDTPKRRWRFSFSHRGSLASLRSAHAPPQIRLTVRAYFFLGCQNVLLEPKGRAVKVKLVRARRAPASHGAEGWVCSVASETAQLLTT